jgi:hypothetical protein
MFDRQAVGPELTLDQSALTPWSSEAAKTRAEKRDRPTLCSAETRRRSIVLASVVALGVAGSVGCTQVNVAVAPTTSTTGEASAGESSSTVPVPSSISADASIQTTDDGVLSVTEWKAVQSSLEDQGISVQWPLDVADKFGFDVCDATRNSSSGELTDQFFLKSAENYAKLQEIRDPGASTNFSAPQWAKVTAAIVAKMCLSKARNVAEVRRQQ